MSGKKDSLVSFHSGQEFHTCFVQNTGLDCGDTGKVVSSLWFLKHNFLDRRRSEFNGRLEF